MLVYKLHVPVHGAAGGRRRPQPAPIRGAVPPARPATRGPWTGNMLTSYKGLSGTKIQEQSIARAALSYNGVQLQLPNPLTEDCIAVPSGSIIFVRFRAICDRKQYGWGVPAVRDGRLKQAGTTATNGVVTSTWCHARVERILSLALICIFRLRSRGSYKSSARY